MSVAASGVFRICVCVCVFYFCCIFNCGIVVVIVVVMAPIRDLFARATPDGTRLRLAQLGSQYVARSNALALAHTRDQAKRRQQHRPDRMYSILYYM